MENKIIIQGARVHNLKNVSLELPKNKLIVFTGVSGSGKSSLAFDTIFAEGQRRYIESLSPYARQFLGEMERAEVDDIIGLSPAIAIGQKGLSRNPRSTVGTLTEIYDFLRVLFSRLGEPHCPKCGHKIEKLSLEEMVDIITAEAKSAKAETVTILAPTVRGRKGEYYQLLYDFLNLGFSQSRIDGKWHSLHSRIKLSRYKPHNIDIVIDRVMPSDESRLFEAVEIGLKHGSGLVKIMLGEKTDKETEFILSSEWAYPNDNFSFPEIEPRLFSFNSPFGACPECHGLGKESLFSDKICPECDGKRLKPEALAIKIKGKNIYDLCQLSIDRLAEFFIDYESKLKEKQKTIGKSVLKEINDRVGFMLKVGLNYLFLAREAGTLSGGEAQRIRLASQIGSRLSNTLYVLDEPTIGLHERDTDRLIETLITLKERSNTVIVVEHDEKTIFASDYLVDLGPMAGRQGGEIVAEGKTEDLLSGDYQKPSLTLDYLTEKRKIALPENRRKVIRQKIKIFGAKANNLKGFHVDIPLKKLVCITGVSGSGKSSLMRDAFYENLIKIKSGVKIPLTGVSRIEGAEDIHRVNMISQSPIGRTPRSNPATYTGVFTHIRNFYAELEESRTRCYGPARFSFNVPGGRCEACGGAGYNLVEMHFLPPVLVKCDICQSKRFSRETLQVKYKKKNISEVLDMTVDEAYNFFEDNYLVSDKLKILKNVGLGYIQLGQSATTLSGGEVQRIRLARELNQSLGKSTLYLLDEPTVGLHWHDIEMLLKILNKLVDQGNTVVVIEHNMQIIKSADYIIDLGPEGGEAGGELVAFGTPEEVANNPKSLTGKYLKKYLKK